MNGKDTETGTGLVCTVVSIAGRGLYRSVDADAAIIEAFHRESAALPPGFPPGKRNISPITDF